MAEHISKQFDLELETIRTRVLQMGGLVEQQIGNAVQALLDGDTDRLSQVMADDVQVNEVEGEQTTVLELKVAKEDLGKVIGKQGRTARAMRTILSAASIKCKKRTVLEILE